MRAVLWLALGLVLLAWAAELGASDAPTILTAAVFATGVSCAIPQSLWAVWREWRQ